MKKVNKKPSVKSCETSFTFAIICSQCSLICFFVIGKAWDCKLCLCTHTTRHTVTHSLTNKTFKRKENKNNTKSKNWIKMKQWKASDRLENNLALCDNNSPCFFFLSWRKRQRCKLQVVGSRSSWKVCPNLTLDILMYKKDTKHFFYLFLTFDMRS